MTCLRYATFETLPVIWDISCVKTLVFWRKSCRVEIVCNIVENSPGKYVLKNIWSHSLRYYREVVNRLQQCSRNRDFWTIHRHQFARPPTPENFFRAKWRHFHRPCASCGNCYAYILIAFVDSCHDNKLSLSGRLLFWIGGKVVRRQDPLEWAWIKERQIRKIPSAVFIRVNTRISSKELAEDKRARDCKCFPIFVLQA